MYKGELTPRRELENLDYAKNLEAEYSRTPEGYERGPCGVLTPVTPQRLVRFFTIFFIMFVRSFVFSFSIS